MDATQLAKAVVHWLEFERLCGRERLLTEAALKMPVHQFLAASDPNGVFMEDPFPGLPTALAKMPGRKKSFDFCLRRPGGGRAYQDVAESKFVNDRRSFAQEVLDDLYRLRWAKFRSQTQPCQRWLLIAGQWKDIHAQVLNKGSTKRKPVVDVALYGVLHRTLAKLHTVDVRNSSTTQRKRWARAAKQMLQNNLPSQFKTRLEAAFPALDPVPSDTVFVCLIWRVIKPMRRRHR
jgi:hypothetical protein